MIYHNIKKHLLWLIIMFCCTNYNQPIYGQLPRFVSIKSQELNMRAGPGQSYPVKFVYKYKNYPVEIIAEFEHWRLIKDHEKTQGWVHQSLLSGVRYAYICSAYSYEKYSIPKNQIILFRLPDETSYPIVKIEIGSVVKVKKCTETWCKVEIQGLQGWLKKSILWGVYQDELLND